MDLIPISKNEGRLGNIEISSFTALDDKGGKLSIISQHLDVYSPQNPEADENHVFIADKREPLYLDKTIGRGGHGLMYAARIEKDIPVVVKVLFKTIDMDIFTGLHEELSEVIPYLLLSSYPNCSNFIVCMRDYFAIQLRDGLHFAIVYEPMDGDIFHLTQRIGDSVYMLDRLYIWLYCLFGICMDVSALHKMGFTHGNIRDKNIYWKLTEDKTGLRIKLSGMRSICHQNKEVIEKAFEKARIGPLFDFYEMECKISGDMWFLPKSSWHEINDYVSDTSKRITNDSYAICMCAKNMFYNLKLGREYGDIWNLEGIKWRMPINADTIAKTDVPITQILEQLNVKTGPLYKACVDLNIAIRKCSLSLMTESLTTILSELIKLRGKGIPNIKAIMS
jgi:hypothetical protein